jgi:peptide deformylase
MPDEWIRPWGDPVLREVAAPVTSFDDILRRQAERMRRRLTAAAGAGLAATQVGILRRLFAYRLRAEDEIEVLVNPRVVWASADTTVFVEGCLSFNAIVVAVERPRAVVVEAQDLDGGERRVETDGFGASLLQHEIDHLDGILTLDRVHPGERARAIRELLDAGAVQLAPVA